MPKPSHLYIHIPFCVEKCAYCDFASVKYNKHLVKAYLMALNEEFQLKCMNVVPQTIYIGGGTPSILAEEELGILLQTVTNLDLSALEEFTFEVNPGTVSVEKFMTLKDYHVNRISIGMQSFNDEALNILGRIHNSKQGKAAFTMAREAGFENISIDLINSWPGQTPAMWLDDLEAAVKIDAKHISSYCLSYEEGTPIFRKREEGKLAVVSEEIERQIFDLTGKFLASKKFDRYEISAYAKEGHFSRHNISYWLGEEYLGLGSAAFSYADGMRYANCRDPEIYIRMIAETGTARNWQETLDPEKRARERAVINLRMTEGINLEKFRNETGFSFDEIYKEEKGQLLDGGWLEYNDGFVRLTEKALPVADSILMEFI